MWPSCHGPNISLPTHQYFTEYFLEQVWHEQSPSIQAFLLHTAILENLSGSLCAAITGLQGGQQMYQALRSLGIETQLVIYPNEFHGITRPSYVKDRYERYLGWYDKYVKKTAPVKNVAEAATR